MAIASSSVLLLNSQLNARATQLAGGQIEVYPGTAVAVDTSAPGVAACLIFTAVSLGTAAAGAIADDGGTYETTGIAAVTATWWRYYNVGKTMWMQGLCATSGGTMNLTTTAITVGGPVSITGISIHY